MTPIIAMSGLSEAAALYALYLGYAGVIFTGIFVAASAIRRSLLFLFLSVGILFAMSLYVRPWLVWTDPYTASCPQDPDAIYWDSRFGAFGIVWICSIVAIFADTGWLIINKLKHRKAEPTSADDSATRVAL